MCPPRASSFLSLDRAKEEGKWCKEIERWQPRGFFVGRVEKSGDKKDSLHFFFFDNMSWDGFKSTSQDVELFFFFLPLSISGVFKGSGGFLGKRRSEKGAQTEQKGKI